MYQVVDGRIVFETGKLFTYESEALRVNQTGQDYIRQFIYKEVNLFVPNYWDWSWVVERGDYRGKLPARISKFVSEHRVNLSPLQLSEIGNIANRYMLRGIKYVFDITQDFDWRPGNFADAGSCYWGERCGAREMLEENGAYAVRFYDPEANLEADLPVLVRRAGIGRAWMARCGKTQFAVFNGYGLGLSDIVQVLAAKSGLLYQPIWLENNGECDNELWINCGSGKSNAYLVGSELIRADDEERYVTIDLEMPEKSGHYCDRCGAGIHDDDYWVAPDGDHYCEDCWDERCFSCYRCGEAGWWDDRIEYNYDYYCEDCADRVSVECDRCGDRVARIRAETVNDTAWCDDCADRYAAECCECGNFFERDDMYEIKGGWVCYDCSRYCSECDQRLPKSDTTTIIGNRWICDDCAQEMEEINAAVA